LGKLDYAWPVLVYYSLGGLSVALFQKVACGHLFHQDFFITFG